MKTLSIHAFNAFSRANETEMFAIRTNQGIVYATKDYMIKKAKNIGKNINDILSNSGQYVINAEEVTERHEGVEYTYTDRDDVEQTTTPNSDFLEVGSFDLALNQAGSLNQMIADSVANRIADQLVGAFSGLGMSTNQNTVSSDDSEDSEDSDDFEIDDTVVIPDEAEVVTTKKVAKKAAKKKKEKK